MRVQMARQCRPVMYVIFGMFSDGKKADGLQVPRLPRVMAPRCQTFAKTKQDLRRVGEVNPGKGLGSCGSNDAVNRDSCPVYNFE